MADQNTPTEPRTVGSDGTVTGQQDQPAQAPQAPQAPQQPATQPASPAPDPYGHLSAEDRQVALAMDQKGLPHEARPDRFVPQTGEPDYSSVSDAVSRAAEEWGRESGQLPTDQGEGEGEQVGDTAEAISQALTAQGPAGQLVSDPDTAAQVGQIAAEAAFTTAEVKQAVLEAGAGYGPQNGFEALTSRLGGNQSKAEKAVASANETLKNHPNLRAFLDANPAVANSPSVVIALAE